MSIGRIISGIDTRPTAVETHRPFKIDLTFLLCRKRTPAQILLIVKPGTITDAKPCHSRVSDVERNNFFIRSGEKSVCK